MSFVRKTCVHIRAFTYSIHIIMRTIPIVSTVYFNFSTVFPIQISLYKVIFRPYPQILALL